MNQSESKYGQVAEIIAKRIEKGVYRNGGLPGLRVLAAEFSVNYLTVRQALHALCDREVLQVNGNRNFEVRQRPDVSKITVGLLCPVGSGEGALIQAARRAMADEPRVVGRIHYFVDYHDPEITTALDKNYDLTFFHVNPQLLPAVLKEKVEKKRDRLISIAFDYSNCHIACIEEADPKDSIRMLLKRLASLGHRHLDILAPVHKHSILDERIAICECLADKMNLASTCVRRTVPEFHQEHDLAAKMASDLYGRGMKPDAIFTPTVPAAIGVQRALKDCGYTPGLDCSLVSCEDIVLARNSIPSVAVAYTPGMDEAIRRAIKDRLEGLSPKSWRPRRAELFEGESVLDAPREESSNV